MSNGDLSEYKKIIADNIRVSKIMNGIVFILLIVAGFCFFWLRGVHYSHEILVILIFFFSNLLMLISFVIGSGARRNAESKINLVKEGWPEDVRLHEELERSFYGTSTFGFIIGIFFFIVFAVSSFMAFAFSLFMAGGGGAWGRPLRIRGKVVHADLEEGENWIDGQFPNVEGLDSATAEALEALWIHDAKKEHASVPAFSRLSWNLTAVGAPPELLRRVQIAAIEEIEHAQKCLALASGFGGRNWTFDDFPQLLNELSDIKGQPEIHLAKESLLDGCLLEEFNADIAALCAKECEDPASKAVLSQIAKEERSHAALSWDIVQFMMTKNTQVIAMLLKEIEQLEKVKRPTVATKESEALVEKADPSLLLKYGRIPDERWAQMWDKRMQLVRNRLRKMIDDHQQKVTGTGSHPDVPLI